MRERQVVTKTKRRETPVWMSQNEEGGNIADDWVMSRTEKNILVSIIDPEPALPYPLQELPMSYGPPAQEYVIPPAARCAVLEKLYPFFPCPTLEDIRYDLHEEKIFKVADFKVIRENGRNYLVSPYYPQSGGMVIDWMDDDEANSQILFAQR